MISSRLSGRLARVMFALGVALLTTACDTPVTTAPILARPGTMTPEQAARAFVQVSAAVEPVAEAECRRLLPTRNCNFRIVVDPDRNAEPNAYQSLDSSGRPVITFTLSMIARSANPDELAFVMSHEAAHHIRDHLGRQRRNAEAGAVVFGGLATLTGASVNDVANAQRLGAAVGARSYSKEFELEADQLGTVIAYRAGYDPRIGVGFFSRIPDPGDTFLGTHPPNAARIQIVRRTAGALGLT